MAVFGYIRVSSAKQNCDHQHYEIQQFAEHNNINVDKWIEETISSRKPLNKRKLGQLLNELQDGDILIAAAISRLGRSMMEVMRILETCLNKNCEVWTIKEHYRLGNDIQSKVMAFAFGLSAEIERNLISQRTKASLESIKASGKKIGRPFAASSKKLKLSKNTKKVKKFLEMGLTHYRIGKILGVKPATVSHFVNRMGW